MKKRFTILLVCAIAVFIVMPTIQAGEWSIKADYNESCSCDVPCPCVFGSPPSKGHCDVNGFLEIESGNLGDITFEGIQCSLSSRLGKWVKFYFSENTTEEQTKAIIEILQKADVFGMYFPETIEVLSIEMVPLSIEKGEKSVKFSTPESQVEIEQVIGLNGEPIHINNLGLKVMVGHTQYKSVVTSHKSDELEFSYSNSNGLTSKIDISSEG